MFFKISVLKTSAKIHRKTTVLESLCSCRPIAADQACNFIQKENQKILIEHLGVNAAVDAQLTSLFVDGQLVCCFYNTCFW